MVRKGLRTALAVAGLSMALASMPAAAQQLGGNGMNRVVSPRRTDGPGGFRRTVEPPVVSEGPWAQIDGGPRITEPSKGTWVEDPRTGRIIKTPRQPDPKPWIHWADE